ncbi:MULTISPECIES: DUF2513 domain-containing protein [Pseudomonas]|uniref:DUF2513 domain-containing protein n=1 Tax=Pseudomonas TaxID=286 RepID=UPI00123BC680|nr:MULTISPECIES: DUF2513 domain-containing protein [Pseudomonas]QIB50071.1 DUF2513 domain-containing protein [Pseudomonas sp. OIL-1]
MKLDKDLVREILLAVEASSPGESITLSLENRTDQEISYHVLLLHEAGLLVGQDASVLADVFAVWKAKRLTYKGHEFLDTVRDGEVWRRTKAGAEKAGVASLGLIFELGKSVGKQLIKERLGIDLP